MQLLTINNLCVEADDKKILNNVCLNIGSGEIHVIMGPNGAGKSTLGNALMGNPSYKITNGSIVFDGKDITNETADKRANAGIFMSFQSPLEVPGISLESFIRNALRIKTGKPVKLMQFTKQMNETMELLDMDLSYSERDLNVGFSGGEKKKAEILQMLMLSPKLCILDETDSGLDVDAVRVVSKGINEYIKRTGGSLIIVTHNANILESLNVTKAHILVKGQIVKDGGNELIDDINENGFEKYISEA